MASIDLDKILLANRIDVRWLTGGVGGFLLVILYCIGDFGCTRPYVDIYYHPPLLILLTGNNY
jgi:hypothetical protein